MLILGLSLILQIFQVLASSRISYIVAGRKVAECEQPYIVHLLITKTSNENFNCAGTIVDNSHIITAAHCISSDVKYVYILYGSVSKSKFTSIVRVSNYTVHKMFEKTDDNILNDVALLTLSTPLQFNKCLQPVQLATACEKYQGDCLISGWGKTSTLGEEPDTLQTAEVSLMDQGKCAAHLAIKEQQICVGTGKVNSEAICRGDSGGPLVCTSAKDGSRVLVGVASFGWTCTEGVSVFARVSYFKDWIKTNLRSWN
ncbi:chymotrypsin-1 isoform X2 [Octopus bimaculoides]|uniref:Peptidase S1 domain-containing protein n=1 Tax=Octopus bimaculoides TaxID=37653 RepID=A0A0L8ICK7_OCTBM|nr:chymotrypsin-1 isoform X2 [Octopus bimaculoides]|eukprot:XP_014776750.1 PREDICTED: chymotrypsin-1-like [Octopus bimaculoides]